jgi:REP element-mobilizing transposase RayT
MSQISLSPIVGVSRMNAIFPNPSSEDVLAALDGTDSTRSAPTVSVRMSKRSNRDTEPPPPEVALVYRFDRKPIPELHADGLGATQPARKSRPYGAHAEQSRIMRFMPYDRERHHRRSIRLQGYDYAGHGSYYVTICAAGRECVFGEVRDDEVVLSDLGRIVAYEWRRSAEIRRELTIGPFVVMPNHMHGIVSIVHEAEPVGAHGHAPLRRDLYRPARSIGSFVGRFKGAVTRRINAMRDTPGTPVWQRNYYEHVIRDQEDFNRIAAYIEDNPRHWAEDEYHP